MLSFFPLDVLDEIWDLIESVFERFLTYSCTYCNCVWGDEDTGMQCDSCECWVCLTCTQMPEEMYDMFNKYTKCAKTRSDVNAFKWVCKHCDQSSLTLKKRIKIWLVLNSRFDAIEEQVRNVESSIKEKCCM